MKNCKKCKASIWIKAVNDEEGIRVRCTNCGTSSAPCSSLDFAVSHWDSINQDDEAELPAPDPVNPPHYKGTAVEPIDAIEAWGLGFALGNAVKYIARAGRKGDRIEDLRKARWYLDRAIEKGAAE